MNEKITTLDVLNEAFTALGEQIVENRLLAKANREFQDKLIARADPFAQEDNAEEKHNGD